jgi:hypothetical protein
LKVFILQFQIQILLIWRVDNENEIVHPEPHTDGDWVPFITADDFYENYGMVIDLIYYAISGEALPEEDE